MGDLNLNLLKYSSYKETDNFLHIMENPKKLLNGIKRMITYTSKRHRTPNKIKHNNIEITDPKAIANVLNKYFADIENEIARSILDTNATSSQFLKPQLPTSAAEIEQEISKLNVSKATGLLVYQ